MTLVLLVAMLVLGESLGLPAWAHLMLLALIVLPVLLVVSVRHRWALEGRPLRPRWLPPRVSRWLRWSAATAIGLAAVWHWQVAVCERNLRGLETQVMMATDRINEGIKLETRLPELRSMIRELAGRLPPGEAWRIQQLYRTVPLEPYPECRDDLSATLQRAYGFGDPDEGQVWLWPLTRQVAALRAELARLCLEERRLLPILTEKELAARLREAGRRLGLEPTDAGRVGP